MQHIRQLITLTLVLMVSHGAYASLLSWTDPTPNALAPFQNNSKYVAELAAQDILIYSHPAQKISFNSTNGMRTYNSAQFSSAALVVNAPIDQVASTLKNYNSYVGLFPTLKKATTLESNNQDTMVKYRISIPTPIKVLNFNEDATLQHRIGNNSLSTIVVDSPFLYGMGKLEWFALDKTRTLVTITQWADVNSTKGFLINTLLKAMPEIKDGIPYGSNTFILESLNRKFNGKANVTTLGAGQLPTKNLNKNQYQQVIQLSQKTGQPVSFIHTPAAVPYKHGNETLRFTTSYQYFKSPTTTSAQLLDAKTYQTLFPKLVRSIDMINIDDRTNDAVFNVRAGLGVITIPFNLRLRFTDLNAQSKDMDAVGGDLKFVRSRMFILPYGTGSVWKIVGGGKIDDSAPFLLRAMRSLPYHDVLPSAVIASVINAQAKRKMNL